MNKKDLEALRQLKKSVEEVFKKRFVDCTEAIEDWKGKRIKQFQQDLITAVGGHVSEKWFYTHIKTTENKKLPRVDILNLLSVYVGYESWNDYINSIELPLVSVAEVEREQAVVVSEENLVEHVPQNEYAEVKKEPSAKSRVWLWGVMASMAVLLLATTFQLMASTSTKYRFCFVDADDQTTVNPKLLKIQWLKKNESPLVLNCDSAGCIELEPSTATIQLVVGGLYYRTDTIVRQLNTKTTEETIELRKDDYALMLHYFSKTKITDWKKRRAQLAALIAPDARIIQVYEANNLGMELYNKEEFIDKLTMPIGSLGKIEVLEMHYSQDGLMQDIRFMQVD